MRTRKLETRSVFSSMVFLFLALTLVAPGAGAQKQEDDSPYHVALKSRQFVPTPGLEPDLARALDSVLVERQHVLLQFAELPTAEQRAALEQKGIYLLNYVPHHAWFASLPASMSAQDLASPSIRWVGRISAADRLAPALRRTGTGAREHPDELEIRFFADVSPAEAVLTLRSHGAQVVSQEPAWGRFVVRLGPAAIDSLAQEDGVLWVAPAPPPKIGDNDGVRARTNVDVVHDAPYGLTGNGVDLGIWDGGVVDSHDDFTGRLTIADPYSPIGEHATHVAGTMAGDGRNSASQGGAAQQWKGMAPGAGIVSYDWSDSLVEHDQAIHTHGIELSQNSWGFDVSAARGNCWLYGDYDAMAPDYDGIVAGRYGARISVVFSAGNERDDGDCGMSAGPPYIHYANIAPPHTAKNAIIVGATHSNDDSMTDFSSWGPLDDGRLKPDVVAPGCESGGEGHIHSTLPGNTYGGPGYCGTSMAAPAVSGMSALLIEQYRATEGSDPLPSTIRALLMHTAVDMDDQTTVYYNPGPDYASGYGRVDAQAAVDAILARQTHEDRVGNGETHTYTMSVPAGSPSLKVTLAWDDPPGTPNAIPALVNNLDLVLVAADGSTTHHPWVLDPANPTSHATRGVDRINNVEQIVVNRPAAGTWAVRVTGAEVPQAPQLYSLVGGVSDRDPGDDTIRVSVFKTVEPATISAGGLLTYTIRRSLALSGTHTYSETWVDPIPASTAYVANSITLNGAPVTGIYSPTLDSLHLEQSGTFTTSHEWILTFQVQVNNVVSVITNTVTGTVSVDGIAPGVLYTASATGQCAAPPAPLPFAPANGAVRCDPEPAFAWTWVSQAEGYRIQIADDPSFGSSILDQRVGDTFYTPPHPLPAGTYDWRVRSENGCGPSAWSETRSLTVLSGPPVPTLLSPADGSQSSDQTPTLTWEDVSGVDSWLVQVDGDSDFGSPLIEETVATTAYTPSTGLGTGAYHWRVRASNACGTGPWSAPWTVTITPVENLYLPVVIYGAP